MKRFDIFDLLNRISNGDLEYVKYLSDDELKDISPYVIQLWLKGADNNINARYRLMNETHNSFVFPLQKHKKLLLSLMCVSNGFGIKTFYKFRKKEQHKQQKSIELISKYYKCSEREAREYIKLLSVEDIKEMTEYYGYDDKETAKVLGEWND